jgi:hypothetical protein
MRCAGVGSKARERRFGTSLRALLLMAIGTPFVIAAVPARATCPLTDLACVTGTVTETVDQVTEPVTEPVNEVTDPVTGTVGGVVDKVKDTVGPIVDEVPVPPQLPDPSLDVNQPTTGDSGSGPGPGAPQGGSGNGSSDPGTGSSVERPIPVQALVGGTFISGVASSPSSDVRIGPSPPPERTISLEDVVKGFAFPLALVLIVGAFLLVQDRLDRRDPRLALAPVGPDVLDFA